MKKYYCFYCQQDVTPQTFLWWRTCPHCRHKITDKGEGFYRVCERCGANMPVDAHYCVKCGNGADQNQLIERYMQIKSPWMVRIIGAIAVALSVLLAFGIVYISFYLIFALLVVALAYFIFDLLWPLNRR